MGAALSRSEIVVVLSGLDGAGKSALLRTARDGQTLPIVERSGVIYEVMTLGEDGREFAAHSKCATAESLPHTPSVRRDSRGGDRRVSLPSGSRGRERQRRQQRPRARDQSIGSAGTLVALGALLHREELPVRLHPGLCGSRTRRPAGKPSTGEAGHARGPAAWRLVALAARMPLSGLRIRIAQ